MKNAQKLHSTHMWYTIAILKQTYPTPMYIIVYFEFERIFLLLLTVYIFRRQNSVIMRNCIESYHLKEYNLNHIAEYAPLVAYNENALCITLRYFSTFPLCLLLHFWAAHTSLIRINKNVHNNTRNIWRIYLGNFANIYAHWIHKSVYI